MEWVVLTAFAVLAAALIALPGRRAEPVQAASDDETASLAAERRLLLDELRELDDDAAAGRISHDDRIAARRNLAPRLRAVTEALRERGAGLPERRT